jgi:uncharacterized protein YxeA
MSKIVLIIIILLLWIAGALLYTWNRDLTHQNEELTARLSELQLRYDQEQEKQKKLEKQKELAKLPKYIREGWEQIEALVTNYSWDEPLEKKWRGKSCFNKSIKNDYGCATTLKLIPRYSEVYFPDIKDYRIADDSFNEEKNRDLLKYWEKKTGKNLTYHIDRRWKCVKDWKGKAKTGIMKVWVKRRITDEDND